MSTAMRFLSYMAGIALAVSVLANQAAADDRKELGAPSGFLEESTDASMEVEAFRSPPASTRLNRN
jgi:hypothetical protein